MTSLAIISATNEAICAQLTLLADLVDGLAIDVSRLVKVIEEAGPALGLFVGDLAVEELDVEQLLRED
jgi:hypothetical protein